MPRSEKPAATSRQPRQPERLDLAYEVSYWPSVGRDVVKWAMENGDFVPTLDTLLDELETNPKHYPEKFDELAGARAAEIIYRGKTWRARVPEAPRA
jgi:hypothetical protein